MPTVQYDPLTFWMSEPTPLTKKPRSVRPCQRRNINKHYQQQHRPQQHQKQPNEEKSQPPSKTFTKRLIDDRLPEKHYFPEKPQRLE